jgi:hypothetical protein
LVVIYSLPAAHGATRCSRKEQQKTAIASLLEIAHHPARPHWAAKPAEQDARPGRSNANS